MGLRATVSFGGTERFRILRRIGEGGMGVVYEADDLERNCRVALKTLRTREPRAILRLKHEFRALQDLEHPNLVRIGELFESEGNWFFSMELIDGVDFLSYVGWSRSALPAPTSGDDTAVDSAESPTRDLSPRRAPVPASEATTLDEAKLRQGLIQLARGLVALHEANKVHRDIKPSNILVSPDDRLVILDFGLVSDLIHDPGDGNDEIAGTLTFMAPEQTTNDAVGPPADWYAVGVLLYLALTGRVPLQGPRETLIELKRTIEPEPPHVLRPDVAADLDALCSDLLRIDPTLRPTGRQILRRLGAAVPGSLLDTTSIHRSTFVGRDAELSVLQQSFADVRSGQTVIHLVHGESGVGKSTLVRQFTRRLGDEVPEAVILAGRCHERESVPYKALDEIIDALSRRLRQFSAVDAAAVLPRMAALVTQAFPVLLDVEAFARAPQPTHDIRDPKERRRRVFMELRELFARLSDRRPLVLVIDDLQWADGDSLALLSEIVRPPHAPELLLVATVRETSESGSPGSSRLHAWCSSIGELRQLHLHNLPPVDANRLAALLLQQGAGRGLDATTIAAESDGHPLFIDALVRHRMAPGAQAGDVRLDDALWMRIASLGPLPRRLVELVAITGRPLPQAVLARAAGVEAGEFSETVSLLRRANLIRTEGIRATDTIEAYHDRVRVAVSAHVEPAQLIRSHERLAFALESLGSNDLEALAVHWQGAGHAERGARFAIRAAAQAAEALAFERAAQLLRTALDAHPFELDEKRDLQTRLANALALAARSAEAAEVFHAAASTATGAEALELQRRAAEQLLISGHIDAGLAEVTSVLGAAGLTLPTTPRRAAVSLLLRRARIRLRGLRFRERGPSDIAPSVLKLIDLTFSISQGLIWVDVIRGAEFQTRHVLLALKAGEPYRLARALAIEAGFAATSGGRGMLRAAPLLDTAQALAEKGGNAHALGFVMGARAFAAVAQGGWKQARELSEKAETIFAERCIGVPWELALVRTNLLWSLNQMGALRELASRGFNYMHTALGRGDLFARASMICGPLSLALLGEDDPDGARRSVDDVMARWSQSGFHLQHLYAFIARSDADLYSGDARAAYRRIDESWPALKRSLLMHFQITRILAYQSRVRAAAALAAISAGTEQKRLLDEVKRLTRRLAAEGIPFCDAVASMFRAEHALGCGRAELADTLFDEGAQKLDAVDMSLYASAMRRRRGLLLGGDRGAELVAAADLQMASQGVKHPARMAAVFVPAPVA
jgi:serine/threonine protein kinase